jgi:hypothetical protein
MKTKRILPLIALLSLGVSLPQTVDAGFFDNIKKMEKKAGGALKKAAHGSIGEKAIQAGGKAISRKMGPEAAAKFQSAAQSMHLADKADSAAHRADHEAKKKAYEDAGGDFDTDYETHVASKIRKAVKNQTDDGNDADNDDTDASSPDGDSDAGDSQSDTDASSPSDDDSDNQ